MIDPSAVAPVRRMADGQWQTVAGGLAVVAITAIAGRWLAGPSFGYAVFVTIWGPLAAVYLLTSTSRFRDQLVVCSISTFLFAWPWLSIEPTGAALRMTILLAGFVSAAVAICQLLTRLVGTSGKAVAAIGWLAWVILPLTMSASLADKVGDVWTVRLLAVQPVIALNAASATAGDWTHQSVAYRHLTRLGQDVPMDWPTSIGPAVSAYFGFTVAISVLCLGVDRIVPRGTNSAPADLMFYVEH